MNENRPKRPEGRMPGGIMTVLLGALALTLIINIFMSLLSGNAMQEVQYSEFLQMLNDGRVAKVEIRSDRLIIHLKEDAEQENGQAGNESGRTPSGLIESATERAENQLAVRRTDQERVYNTVYYTGYIHNPELLRLMEEQEVEFFAAVRNSNPVLDFIVSWILPIVLIYGLFMLLMRSVANRMGGGKGGFMSIGQSTAKVYMEKKTGVTFEDVAGQEEAKESLTEIVDFLHNPDKYTAIGAIQPKGALLVGPPGTGKTLLAKAVAGEANVVFFSLSGSDFVEMFVGVGASRVRDLFKQAGQQAPCIIFIDEIDAIGKSRDSQFSSNDEREQTLNQLLAEMDGFDSSKGVVILGATNRPEILDKALLRPGRFDRRIIVELPDLKGREDILAVHAKKVKMSGEVDLRKIALATPGAAGADLANMINEGALRAVRMKRNEVEQDDLMEAVEVVIAGKEKKDRIMTEQEKRIVSFHEVGHAMAAALLTHRQPVQKITIVPRTMGSLGYTMYLPEEERYMHTKDEMLDKITVMLAGRAAEKVEFGIETTGSSNDIERATKIARSMVSMYGMSEKIGMMGLESIESRYLDGRPVTNCSEQTAAELDKEVSAMLHMCFEKAMALLQDNSGKLKKIAACLFEKETLGGEEFMEMVK
ncbi:MAG: ATP-dependent zinc metalloprotease FtsH [Defluviitaleaceae bacterium]|nr:ATP-dependent zinc metalloprotease FtsH [Defluviitaleaceae bacterium]